MRTAQRLYENGYITYMRTDSTTLSETALNAARAQARELYGDEYVPDAPRRYERKVKNAQEAHEAIRPAGDTLPHARRAGARAQRRRAPALRADLAAHGRLADDRRARAVGHRARRGRLVAAARRAEFSASGKVITFPGFLRAYVEGADDADAERDDRESRLPQLAEGQALTRDGLEPVGHATTPPARYTEASLVKALEELGIGRPSTYASILGTIQDRGYVFKRGTALVPSFTAFAVVGLLEQHFGRLVDYGFTASMEDDLDEIASGERERTPWLARFYFGERRGRDRGRTDPHGRRSSRCERLGEIDAREVNSLPIGDDARAARSSPASAATGPYVQKGDDCGRASPTTCRRTS